MDRKKFIVSTCALCAAGAFLPLLDSCSKPKIDTFMLDLTDPANADLLTVGGGVTNSQGVEVVHTSSGYKAFSTKCTHEGCTVAYTKSDTRFHCPCHGGVFNIDGGVVSGPPPRALPHYSVSQNGNTLTISN